MDLDTLANARLKGDYDMLGQRKLAELLNRITCGDAVILCGAGVSKRLPSDLPLWSEMRLHLLEALCSGSRIATKYTPLLLKLSLPMELLLQVIYEEVGDSVLDLLAFLNTCNYNANHWTLAHLLARGYVQQVVTTNFDPLIEKALLDIGVPFRLWTEGKRPRHVVHRIPEVLKIHGTIETPRSIRALLHQVALPTKDGVCLFQEIIRSRFLLVIGYSGNDFDLFPVFFDARPREITWILKPGERAPHLRRLCRQFPSNVTITRCDLNRLLDQVARSTHIEFQAFRNKRQHAQERPRRSVRFWAQHLNTCDRLSIVGRLLQYGGHTTAAIDCFRSALIQARRANDHVRQYYLLRDCADLAEFTGEIVSAEKYIALQWGLLPYFEKTVREDAKCEIQFNERRLDEDDLRSVSELQQLADEIESQGRYEFLPPILSRLAQVRMEKRQHRLALKQLSMDITASRKSEDIIGVIESKLNVAICYADARKRSLAMRQFEDALWWARRLNMPGLLANVEVNMALCELLFQGPEKALSRLKRSLHRFQRIREANGIAFASWNIAYILRHLGIANEAETYSKRARLLIDSARLPQPVPVRDLRLS